MGAGVLSTLGKLAAIFTRHTSFAVVPNLAKEHIQEIPKVKV